MPQLTKNLLGKLFGDKGYIGNPLAQELLRRGLTFFTRVRKNMKSLPLAIPDKLLLNAHNMAETIVAVSSNFLRSICPSTAWRSTLSCTSWLPSPPIKSTPLSPSSNSLQLILLRSLPETHYRGYRILIGDLL